MERDLTDLEAARLQLGIATQTGFAALLGVSPQQYRKIIAGGHPTMTQQRLVQAYLAGYRPADWAEHAGDRRRTAS